MCIMFVDFGFCFRKEFGPLVCVGEIMVGLSEKTRGPVSRPLINFCLPNRQVEIDEGDSVSLF